MLRTQDKRLFLGDPLADVLASHRAQSFAADATASGTQLSAPASANTKGAWTELEDSCPINADGFYVQILRGSATIDLLVDIGTGAASSEVLILSNVLLSASGAGAEFQVDQFYVPLGIPAGTRVVGRYQTSSTTGDQVHVLPQFVTSDHYANLRCARATTYGADTSDSGGTVVDPGASINTKGAYSELSTSVNGIRHALICIGNRANSARSSSSFLIDLAVGGAGSEQVVIPNSLNRAIATMDLPSPTFYERALTVNAGERLAARMACTINDATDRLLDVVVVGFGD